MSHLATAAAAYRHWPALGAMCQRYGWRWTTVLLFRLRCYLAGVAGVGFPIVCDGREVACKFKHTGAYLQSHHHAPKMYWLGAGRFPLFNLDAVQSGQPLWLVAGEPDCITATQAGLLACSVTTGEGSLPREAVRLLVERAPSLMWVLYDNDPAGRDGADAACHALREAGLPAEIRALPPDLGHGGDLSDLYRRLRYDDAALRATLDALPCREPMTPPPRRHAGQHRPRTGASTSAFARIKAQADIVGLARRLTALQESRDGSRYTGSCPFHEDWDPSFVVWPASEERAGRFRCYGCGVGGDVIELARLALERELLP